MANLTQSVDALYMQKNLGSVQDALDKIGRQSIGSLSTVIGDSLRGINHRMTPPPMQQNRDFFGLTFFTRPLMNMSSENLRTERLFTNLLSQDPATIGRYIRGQLDPSLTSTGYQPCPFVDDQSAFIPLLTNNLLSISGWPDVVVDSFSSAPGAYKEVVTFVDDVAAINSTYDITANFRNLPGDPITAMMLYWVYYASLVHEGTLFPYPQFIAEHEIDYQTRIYRLVLDVSRTKVQKIASTAASYPTMSPQGAAFNYDAAEPLNSANDQISIQFKSVGAIYNDPILVWEFNAVVQMFNDGMTDANRPNQYIRIPMKALRIFNNKGYPRIDPATYNLEWWVSKTDWNAALAEVNALPDIVVVQPGT